MYEQLGNEVNGKFTCFGLRGSILYCGTEKSPIVLLDALKGSFIKQIGYPANLLKPLIINHNQEVNPNVVSVQSNASDNLQIYYSNGVSCLLDQ